MRAFHFLVETIATPIFISRGRAVALRKSRAEVLTGYTEKNSYQLIQDLIPLIVENQSIASRCEVRILTKIIRNVGLISLQRRSI